ncbi:MAG: hypothetical protein Q8R92_03470 [Deltaproteobacteria bacterium]|nr:hypothetical protein [Deltaproteobacteria bacterium]
MSTTDTAALTALTAYVEAHAQDWAGLEWDSNVAARAEAKCSCCGRPRQEEEAGLEAEGEPLCTRCHPDGEPPAGGWPSGQCPACEDCEAEGVEPFGERLD